METVKETKSLINQFADNLIKIPDDIIHGTLNAMEDRKFVINEYSKSFNNQFANIVKLIQEQEKKISKETIRCAEELLTVTSCVELTREVKSLASNLGSNIAKNWLSGYYTND